MAVKCLLLEENGTFIDYADLSFMGNEVSFLIPFKEETLSCYKIGDKIVFQVEDRYSQIFDAQISGIAYGKLDLAEIRNLAPLLHNDIRVEIEFHTRIFYVEDDEEVSADICMQDLSCGGMGFVCDKELDLSKEYTIFTNWLDTPILVNLQILRKEKVTYTKYVYGCKFVELLRAEESILRASVFKIQAINHKKKRMEEDYVG